VAAKSRQERARAHQQNSMQILRLAKQPRTLSPSKITTPFIEELVVHAYALHPLAISFTKEEKKEQSSVVHFSSPQQPRRTLLANTRS
jgi:hypothetical protein